MNTPFTFSAKLWIYPSEHAAWHFVSVPVDVGAAIKGAIKEQKVSERKLRGWGSIKVRVTIGSTIWDTSIFPDKHSGSYILPVKSTVRIAEQYQKDDVREVTMVLL